MQYINYTADDLIGKTFTAGNSLTVYTFDRKDGSRVMITWLRTDGTPTSGTPYTLSEINRFLKNKSWQLVESIIKEPYQIY